jgi:histone-lysine N-methyltransferase SETD3
MQNKQAPTIALVLVALAVAYVGTDQWWQNNATNTSSFAGVRNDTLGDDDHEISASSDFRTFVKWLKRSGAQSSALQFKEYSTQVRGAVAKQHVAPYERIMSIPRHLMITEHMGYTGTVIGRCLFPRENDTLDVPDVVAITTYMLETSEDPDHKFQPYYKSLPPDYTNLPVYWGPDKLAWLEGSPLVLDIAERVEAFEEEYQQVIAMCPDFARFSYRAYLDMRSAVGSRSYGVDMDGNETLVMVPHADMLNHKRPRDTTWTFNEARQEFTINTLVPLNVDQEVTISYGAKSNAKFFVHYGFALENNREEMTGESLNDVYINVTLDMANDNQALAEAKRNYLSEKRTSHVFRMHMYIDKKFTKNAFRYLRIIGANEEELARIVKKAKITRHMVSRRNEASALDVLRKVLRKHLAGYPNTYAENKALLASGAVQPFTDRHSALTVIVSEQEVCHFWIHVAEVRF